MFGGGSQRRKDTQERKVDENIEHIDSQGTGTLLCIRVALVLKTLGLRRCFLGASKTSQVYLTFSFYYMMWVS